MESPVGSFSGHYSRLVVLTEALRVGKYALAARELSSQLLDPLAIPRQYRCTYAALLRQIGRPHLALKILEPLIYPRVARGPVATSPEIAEYCASLQRVGEVERARDLLRQLRA